MTVTPVVVDSNAPDPVRTGHRYTFIAAGLVWVFYAGTSSKMVYKTSLDDFTAKYEVRNLTSSNDLCIYFDGTYFHYAAYSGDFIYYRRGLPNADATVTWSADEQDTGVSFSYPAHEYTGNVLLYVDPNGHAIITYNWVSSYFAYGTAIRNLNTDGTWSGDASFAHNSEIDRGYVHIGYIAGAIVMIAKPLYGRYMTYQNWTEASHTWGTETQFYKTGIVPMDDCDNWATGVNYNNKIYLFYADNTDHVLILKEYDGGWKDELYIAINYSIHSLAQVSITPDGYVVVIWVDSANGGTAYYTSDRIWWTQEPVLWFTDAFKPDLGGNYSYVASSCIIASSYGYFCYLASGSDIFKINYLYTPVDLGVEMALNQSIFSDPGSATWTDISPDVMSLHTRRGRMHELNRIEAGTAEIVVNNKSGNYWRYNTASALFPYFKPLTLCRIRKTYNSITYPIYYGVIESIVPGWIEDVGGKAPIVTINCVDFFKTFTRNSIAQGTNFSSELSGIRVYHVLNNITNAAGMGNWPLALASLPFGQVTVTAVSPPTNGVNVMEHLYSVSAAEAGTFFIAASGVVTFQDRDARFTTFANSQATFDTGFSGNIYMSPDMQDDDTYIYNAALIPYAGNGYANWQDTTNLGNQGIRLYQDTNLGEGSSAIIYNSQDAQSLAYVTVNRYIDSKLRALALNLDCDASPADLFPKALGYDISTRITLNLNNTDNPLAIPNLQYNIEGIEHDWHAWQNCWHTKWQLWDVNQYRIFPVTHSGWLENTGGNYTTVHNAASGDSAWRDTSTALIQVGQGLNIATYNIDRGYIEFDTSSLAASPAVANAKVYIYYPGGSQNPLTDVTLDLVSGDGLTNLLIYSNYGDLLGQTAKHGEATVIHTDSSNRWLEFDLTALGIAAINPGGITHWGIRCLNDIGTPAYIAPTLTVEFVNLYGYGQTPAAFLAVQFA